VSNFLPALSPCFCSLCSVPFALQDLISRNADFGARLYRALADRTDENVLLCPFTLSAALTVLLSATNGQTREQLQAGLTLTGLEAQTLPGGFKVKGHQILVVVQVLSGASVVQVASSYLNLVQTKLGGTVQGVDYTEAYEAVKTINHWALEQTVDQVQDFISEVDHQTQLLLAAVTAYRASFTPPFNASSTQDERFYVDSYHVVMVPMMFRADKYLLAYDAAVKAGVVHTHLRMHCRLLTSPRCFRTTLTSATWVELKGPNLNR
uniref:Serpin domain-containing protein n=1 Tax=Oreochromis niloticus TaxID=8128 RepID=I3IUL9_ORENI